MPPRRRRRGLGCLPSLLLLLVLGLAGAMVVETIIGPWIYTVGGRHRYLPVWQGVGDARGPGGTYRLYIWFSPRNQAQHILPEASVQGYSTLCTPRGERLNLKLYGGAPGRHWLTLPEGQRFGINIFRRVAFGLNGPVAPPRLEFEGHWQGPNLVMTDKGGFAHAFNPDGTVREKAAYWHPETEAAPITFTETTGFWLTAPPCPNP